MTLRDRWFGRSGLGRAVIVRTGLALLLTCAVYLLGQSGEGTLRVEIRDKTSGQIVPAMVCITSATDGTWRTPPDGRTQPRFSTVRDFMQPGGDWKPGDTGPVRLTNGEYPGGERVPAYGPLSDYPFWQEPAAYFTSKPFSITLPAGKWRLAVERGTEYLPVFEDFEIKIGQTRNRTIILQRWVNMPQQGWYSGDDHVHYPRNKPVYDEFLMTWSKAEDVHVSNILRMGDIKQTYFEPGNYGKKSRYQEGDYILATGQEDPRAAIEEQGHAMALNIQGPVRDTSKYHLFDFMFDSIHAQGGLTGYAHIAWASEFHRRGHPDRYPTWDPNINVIQGKVDFFELLQFRQLGLEDFYDFLNLGIKLVASAGSDLPWGNTIGESRVYVYTGREFNADIWFAAMKQGHTFVTNGPMLTLRIDNAIPGDELNVSKGRPVRIRARAWAPEIIGSPKKLEVIAQGQVIRTAESSEPGRQELKLDFSLPVGQSQWIAARVSTHKDGLAHTSPVYILVNGKSFAESTDLPQMIEKRLKRLDFIEARLRDPTFIRDYVPGEIKPLIDRIEQARAAYKKLADGRGLGL